MAIPLPDGAQIYSATYSGVPVYELRYGADSVMRRRLDDYINATHILKAAGLEKPARTRILEREVQKDIHQKVQGGYGKYQGTWIPIDKGRELAARNNVLDKIAPIFDFVAGGTSPPPVPKGAGSKPRASRTSTGPAGTAWWWECWKQADHEHADLEVHDGAEHASVAAGSVHDYGARAGAATDYNARHTSRLYACTGPPTTVLRE
ncbi:hypothetical protein KEM55_001368 [Ascosphaera atra]|nr:hypothetical protein KEM55_001368 [Ascosphaera atra]